MLPIASQRNLSYAVTSFYVTWSLSFQVPTSQTAVRWTLTSFFPQSAPVFQCLLSSWGQEKTRWRFLLICSDCSLAWYSNCRYCVCCLASSVYTLHLYQRLCKLSILQVKKFVSDSFLKTLDATLMEVVEVTIVY